MNNQAWRYYTWPLALAGVAGSGGVSAQATTELTPIIVESTRIERDWLETPAALDVVEAEDARQGRQHLQLDESLGRVPGTFAQNRFNFAQDLRLSIRGFGARSAFGIRGLKLIVDGIPETLVDGQSQTDAIDLTTIEEIEVIRGPSSALYGNATGGVIDIETREPSDFPLRQLRLDAGSFDYYRQSVQAGEQYDDWGYFISAYNLDYDGYRENTEVERRLANGKFNIQLGGDASLHAVVRLLDGPVSADPGGLTRAEVDANRRQARDANLIFDSQQAAEQQTLGLVYHDSFTENDDFTARVFYTHRDLTQRLPFEAGGIVTLDRDFFGGGLQYSRDTTFTGRRSRFTAGMDVEQQRDDRQRFDNNNGESGTLTFAQVEAAHSVGLYAQNVLALTDPLELTTGVRYDAIRFEIDDRFTQDLDPDDSGERNFREVNGTIGLSYAVASQQRLYATVGTAFETPTFTEFANPAGRGGFNPNLKPQEALSYEVGARGLLGDRAHYSVAVFRVEVQDELIVFDQDDNIDRDFFENSGESTRNGVEAQMTYSITEHLSSTAAFTYSDFEFETFVDRTGNDFAGHQLPGIPKSQYFSELAYRKPDAGSAILDFTIYDELFADNANAVKVAGYGVVNARLGLEKRLWRRPLTLFLGINNLLDKAYFSNIRINALGGRFYEPAPERSFYAGAKLSL